ncbi:MAG: group III truncated hemoglobin [Saprospiraceae bacterium]|nr:group III truncated hemoglobin [Saprospiraceae bacterium]
MKRDIENREDLDQLVRKFYDKLLADSIMRPIFLDVAKIDLEEHFPHLVEFWHSLLFMTGSYRRNVMDKHLVLHTKIALEEIHFKIWLRYFKNSVDELFLGARSEDAKNRAESIALLMQYKINELNKRQSD